MTNEQQLIQKTKDMIDGLKTVCANYGLGNASSEYKIITEIFLYKYLNDKFIYEVKKVNKEFNKDTSTIDVEEYLYNLEPNDFSILTMRMSSNVAKIKKEYMISYLFNNQNSTSQEFYELFDKALTGISNDNVDIFSVKTGSKESIKLFDELSQYITESNKKNPFFKAIINRLVGFSFEEAFNEKYDFFSVIFEYLIKDYNKDFGKYAEYYTPNLIARIIAKILAPTPTQNVRLYDPAAGSGTLLLALAHQIGEDKCTIYSQDISQKSNEFLRLNLILNNLVHSLGNVIHGDTLLNPAHLNENKNELAKFDYIVSNPPFRTDFSDTRDQLATEKFKNRFFAGVPSIPANKKESMPIYLLFLQHILYSLDKDKGKAAIVVPTGFLTGKSKIEVKIRDTIISNKWLKGAVSMPSNIFANTGTNVSIIFIDKSMENNEVLLMDASNLGEKYKEGKNQKIKLSTKEIDKIINYFINKTEEQKFSIVVSNEEIKNKKFSFSAGQYFKIDIKYTSYTNEEFINEVNRIKEEINELVKVNSVLTENVTKNLEKVKYYENGKN